MNIFNFWGLAFAALVIFTTPNLTFGQVYHPVDLSKTIALPSTNGSSTINGNVIDTQGNPVEGASIRVYHRVITKVKGAPKPLLHCPDVLYLTNVSTISGYLGNFSVSAPTITGENLFYIEVEAYGYEYCYKEAVKPGETVTISLIAKGTMVPTPHILYIPSEYIDANTYYNPSPKSINLASNDSPCGAIDISNTDCNNPLTEDYSPSFASETYPAVLCSGQYTSNVANDLWYKIIVPPCMNACTVTLMPTAAAPDGADVSGQVYTESTNGSCSNLIPGVCVDLTGGSGTGAVLELTGLIPGNTYYIRAYEYDAYHSSTTYTVCCEFSTTMVCDPNVYVDDATLSAQQGCPGQNIDVDFHIVIDNPSAYTSSTLTEIFLVENTGPCPTSIPTTPAITDDYLSVNEASNGDDNESLTVPIDAGTPPGDYYILIAMNTDNGVTETDMTDNFFCIPYTVTAPGPTTLSISSTSIALCNGATATLSVDNPTPGYDITWSSGEQGETISVSTPGTYFATIISCGNTITSNDIVITQPTPLTEAFITGDTFSCDNSIVLTANADSPDALYEWSSSETTQTVEPSQTGTYTVTVSNGCEILAVDYTIEIVMTPSTPVFTPIQSPVCAGTDVLIEVSNVEVGNQYTVTGLPDNTTAQGSSTTFIAPSDGEYSISITSSNVCGADSATITIDVTPLPEDPIILGMPTYVCAFEPVTLWVENVCTGCSMSFTSVPGFGTVLDSIVTFSGPASGTHTVTAIIGNVCATEESNLSFTVTPLPAMPVISCNDNEICTGECTNLESSSGNNILIWNNGTTGQILNVCNGGIFTVTAHDPHCTLGVESQPYQVIEHSAPPHPVVSNIGGYVSTTAGYTYSWQTNGVLVPGGNSNIIPITTTGFYNVTVTNQNGCTADGSGIFALVSMETNNVDKNILVVPNPASDHFGIFMKDCCLEEYADYEIYNSAGTLVKKGDRYKFGDPIEVQEFPSDTYYVRVSFTDNPIFYWFKLIIVN